MVTVNYEQPHCPACGRMLKYVTRAGICKCEYCGEELLIRIEKVNKYIIEAI